MIAVRYRSSSGDRDTLANRQGSASKISPVIRPLRASRRAGIAGTALRVLCTKDSRPLFGPALTPNPLGKPAAEAQDQGVRPPFFEAGVTA